MPSSFAVFLIAAVLTAAAAFWLLLAWRRADGRAGPALALVGVIGVSALGVYFIIGRPDLPDAPFAARLAALHRRDISTYTIDEALAVFSQWAKDQPRVASPHVMTGQALLSRAAYKARAGDEDGARADTQGAAHSFDAALRRDPQSAEAMLGLGRSLVALDEGRVSPDALRLFQQAGAAGRDPEPFMYQALAAMQANDSAAARRAWTEACQRIPVNDPREGMREQACAGARR